MASCSSCSDRWDAEEALTAGMKALRASSWNQRSSAESREILMERFARQNRPRVARRWFWALGAVAAAVVAAIAVPGFVEHRLSVPAAETVQTADGGLPEDSAEFRSDAPVDPEAEGFIAVPFVPPLAMGEMVRVVHTELNPAALASLGVSVDPSWTTQLPADLLLGEDGMPRAVRVSDAMSGDGGF
jgi:hypothetical protein